MRVILPPVIKTQPKSLSVRDGKRASFRVLAKGTGPLSYQWFKDTVPLTNGTKRIFTLAQARTNDAGLYSVLVANVGTNVLSTNTALTILP